MSGSIALAPARRQLRLKLLGASAKHNRLKLGLMVFPAARLEVLLAGLEYWREEMKKAR